jgi:histidyl-tRNA synthetase
LERVVAQLAPAPASRPASILVAAPDAAFQAAMRVADSLRARGHRVLLDVRGRSLQANLRDAERRGCVALVSVEGAAMEEEVVWHDLASHGDSAGPRRMSLPGFVQEMAV